MKKLILIMTIWMIGTAFAASTVSHRAAATVKNHHRHVKKTHTSAKKKQTVKSRTQANQQKKSNKKQKKYYLAPQRTKRHYAANVQTDNVPNVAVPPRSFAASIEDRLVHFVRSTVDTLRYSAYKLGGRKFDTTHGIYVLDCSDYVDNILQAVYPHAYGNLVNATGSEKPTSEHFYHFFNRLESRNNNYWNKIDDVEQLRPGDVLVFRTKNRYGSETGGHVMVVMNKPRSDENVFLVRVADSAPSGHSQDTRQANASGIGIGDLLLKVNPETGAPAAYAWKVGSRWQKNVSFAMARPNGPY